jgi:hypothetical protein
LPRGAPQFAPYVPDTIWIVRCSAPTFAASKTMHNISGIQRMIPLRKAGALSVWRFDLITLRLLASRAARSVSRRCRPDRKRLLPAPTIRSIPGSSF